MSYYDTALNSTENIALSNFLQPILAENTFFYFLSNGRSSRHHKYCIKKLF